MTTTAPLVIGRLVSPPQPGDCWTVVITCPHCGKQHTHGAGYDGTTGDGHRVAHCTGRHAGIHNPGYVIAVANSAAA